MKQYRNMGLSGHGLFILLHFSRITFDGDHGKRVLYYPRFGILLSFPPSLIVVSGVILLVWGKKIKLAKLVIDQIDPNLTTLSMWTDYFYPDFNPKVTKLTK